MPRAETNVSETLARGMWGVAGVRQGRWEPWVEPGGPTNYCVRAQVTLGVPECELLISPASASRLGVCPRLDVAATTKGEEPPPNRALCCPPTCYAVCVFGAHKDPAGMFGARWVWTLGVDVRAENGTDMSSDLRSASGRL